MHFYDVLARDNMKAHQEFTELKQHNNRFYLSSYDYYICETLKMIPNLN